MSTDPKAPGGTASTGAATSPAGRPLTEAARRALAEADARRQAAAAAETPRELGGRGGLDPVRYADWEVGGLAVDF